MEDDLLAVTMLEAGKEMSQNVAFCTYVSTKATAKHFKIFKQG